MNWVCRALVILREGSVGGKGGREERGGYSLGDSSKVKDGAEVK